MPRRYRLLISVTRNQIFWYTTHHQCIEDQLVSQQQHSIWPAGCSKKINGDELQNLQLMVCSSTYILLLKVKSTQAVLSTTAAGPLELVMQLKIVKLSLKWEKSGQLVSWHTPLCDAAAAPPLCTQNSPPRQKGVPNLCVQLCTVVSKLFRKLNRIRYS